MNRIDQTHPDAPDLAGYGPFPIGVQTLPLANPAQIDVLDSALTLRRYDRPLTVELWYPAAPGPPPGTAYATMLRDGHRAITLHGLACRDAAQAEGDFPLVILSHGYPGNRMLMSHLGETLASHGYVVASVDHTDSTYADKGPLASTLVNRPLDTAFVKAALADRADTTRFAIIGYSMGGYGALVSGGAGVAEAALGMDGAPPLGLRFVRSSPSALGAVIAGFGMRKVLPGFGCRCS
jgi:predicted dienelactone hydrolase